MAKLTMTPKDFAPHLLTVIGEMTDFTPGVAVEMEHTYDPVCARIGINPNAFGIAAGKNIPAVHRKIQLAMRQLRDNGLTDYPVRGQWTLTEPGRAALMDGAKMEPSGETQVPVAARVEQNVMDKANETHDHSKAVRIDTRQHPYSNDPYIRGLAIERTACFSAFSSRSDVCRVCSLQRECVAAAGVAKAEIAAEIFREEAEARRLEEQKKATKARQDASINELIASQERDVEIKKTTPDKSRGSGRFKPPKDKQVADACAQMEGECAQCQGRISQGTTCYWVEGEGTFHPECIEVPLS